MCIWYYLGISKYLGIILTSSWTLAFETARYRVAAKLLEAFIYRELSHTFMNYSLLHLSVESLFNKHSKLQYHPQAT